MLDLHNTNPHLIVAVVTFALELQSFTDFYNSLKTTIPILQLCTNCNDF